MSQGPKIGPLVPKGGTKLDPNILIHNVDENSSYVNCSQMPIANYSAPFCYRKVVLLTDYIEIKVLPEYIQCMCWFVQGNKQVEILKGKKKITMRAGMCLRDVLWFLHVL